MTSSEQYHFESQLEPDKKITRQTMAINKPSNSMIAGWKMFDSLSPEEKQKWRDNEKWFQENLHRRDD